MESTDEVLYMCLDKSKSMKNGITDSDGNLVLESCCETPSFAGSSGSVAGCVNVPCTDDIVCGETACAGQTYRFDILKRFEILYRAASNIASTLFPTAGALFDETYIRLFGNEGVITAKDINSNIPFTNTDMYTVTTQAEYTTAIDNYEEEGDYDGDYTYIKECFEEA